MSTKFGKNAPNKSAGANPVAKQPHHVEIKPNVSPSKGGTVIDIKLHTMDTCSTTSTGGQKASYKNIGGK